jgi:sulfate adenylyltransferase subunit 1
MQTGLGSTISSIRLGTQELKTAIAPMSVVMTLKDDIGVDRGDLLALANNLPEAKKELDIIICWMDEKPMNISIEYILKHGTRESKIHIKKINYKIDVNSLNQSRNDLDIRMNDICHVNISSSLPIFIDSYSHNRAMGSAILIDPETNRTVAGILID